ncbi:MAG: MG2 domain-containing protein, partial [Planctomycetota bacterium]
AAAPTGDAASREAVEEAVDAGHWSDALRIARLRIDAGVATPGDLAATVRCLNRLGREQAFDALIQSAAQRYQRDASMLLAAARAYRDAPSHAHRVGSEVRRGHGSGERLSLADSDRYWRMRLAGAAFDATEDPTLQADAAAELALAVLEGRTGRRSWRLQSLTPIEGDPPPATPTWPGPPASDPPAAAGGDGPLLYAVPASFKAAKSDGERWRFCLAEQARLRPSDADACDAAYADFLRQQFGVASLVGRLGPGETRPDADTLRTLGEDETIARLASGVRRFKLSAEHNFLAIDRRTGRWAHVFEELLAREQRGAALDAGRRWLDATDNERQRKRIEAKLAQIERPWATFDATGRVAAGEAPTLRVAHRNAAELRFTARSIDVDRLLADIRAAIERGEPGSAPGGSLDVDRIGWRLVTEAGEAYLGDQVAEWSVTVELAADHADGEAAVAAPVTQAGAYFVTATPTGAGGEAGESVSIALWVDDTVLLRRPAADGWRYRVIDARDGRPIDGAEVELFGFRAERPRGDDAKILTRNVRLTTDADGVAQAPLTGADAADGMQWLAVARGEDGRRAFLGFNGYWGGRRGVDRPGDRPRVVVVSDRPVYRPGDMVRFRAWVGRPDYTTAIDEPVASEFAHQEFQVEFRDARGERIATQRLTADTVGGIDGELALPEGASLGVYRIDVVGVGGGGFRVEEYRKPDFEVTIDAPSEPTRVGEPIEATIRADYYAGTPVRGGRAEYRVLRTRRTARWTPPGPWDWLYGRGYGWLGVDATWREDWSRWGCVCPPPWAPGPSAPPELIAEGTVTLDESGVHTMRVETADAAERWPDADHEYRIAVTVTDSARRTIGAEGRVLAARRPADATVWLDRGFYDAGDTVTANVSLRTPDGRPLAGEGELRLLRITEGDEPAESEIETWSVDVPAGGAAESRLKASEPGRYRLAFAADVAGERVEAGVLFTIRGPGFAGGGFRYNALEVVPDRAEYAPGDTARIAINTDRTGSTVALYVRVAGGVYPAPRTLRLAGKSTVVELPIEVADQPNVFLEAVTVSDGAVHTVTKQLVVPPASRVIDVAVAPSADTFLPGEEGTLRVRLTDADGEPIVGAATIAVYDRSVDAIAGETGERDLRRSFWSWRRSHWPQFADSLSPVEGPVTAPGAPRMQRLASVPMAVRSAPKGASFAFERGGRAVTASGFTDMFAGAAEAAPMAADGAPFGAAPTAEPPTLRSDFADTALWVAAVETDADGFAEVPLPLPESLTAWRVRAWAVAPGMRVGQGESEVTTRKDLMVRLRCPRYLVGGDTATFGAVVQNESPHAVRAVVRWASDGDAVSFAGESARTVTIAAGAEATVEWTARAVAEGEAVLRAWATATPLGEGGQPTAGVAELTDGVERTLGVLVHGAEIVDSRSAVIGPDKRIATFELVVPAERRVDATRLELRYTPTLVGAMLDTLPYLIEYPHGCTEQTLNRFLPAAIVRQTIADLGVDLATLDRDAAGPRPPGRESPVFDAEELNRIVRAGVRRLGEMQIADGGWGWFSGFRERSTSHTTAVVVRGLGLAGRSGVAVDRAAIDRGLDWLARYRDAQLAALANCDAEGEPIDDASPHKRAADNLDALVELTLAEAGRVDGAMLRRLHEDRLGLSPYALAMIGLAEHLASESDAADADEWVGRRDVVIRNLRQFVVRDAENQTATLDMPGGYWWRWYGSGHEANAVFLRLLTATDPRGDLAAGVVKHLLGSRRSGTRWDSTRDTAMVVEALAEYCVASGEAAGSGEVEVWLDGKKRLTQSYDAATALRFDGRFTLAGDALPAGRHTLELRRSGDGRVYAGVALTNFSLEDDLRAAGLDVRVRRRVTRLVPIEATAEDVDGAGGPIATAVERYRRVEVPNVGEVAAGELIEVELIVTSKNDYEYLLIEDPKAAGLEAIDARSGYDHGGGLPAYRELRDDRVRFYARTLPRGEHVLRYRLRAETPGVYSALPAQVSAMYAPELRGNSDELRVSVAEGE